MKKLFILSMLVFFLSMHIMAEVHPKIDELQKYANQNPIDPRVPEILQTISVESMELNGLGYQAYANRQYTAALEYFRKAWEVDGKNSFAWYNHGCTAVLSGKYDESDVLIDLKNAVRKDWFWGLQLMIDPDLDSIRSTDLTELNNRSGYSHLRSGDSFYYITGSGEEQNGDFLDHVFYEDGTVSLRMEKEEVARGYFCYFAMDTPVGGQMIPGSLFEYFPHVKEYTVWYPNSHKDLPARKNGVFFDSYPFPKFP
jgi:hypothetical protein